jgi:hypothetical protein
MDKLLIDQLEAIREDIDDFLNDIQSGVIVSTVFREDIVTALLNWSKDVDGIVAKRSAAIDKHVDSVSYGQLAQIARKMDDILQDAYWDALDEAIQHVMGREWLDAALQGEEDYDYDIDQE